MTPAQRLAESLDRIVMLHRHFSNVGAKVTIEGRTLVLETDINNYFIDISDEEPRFVTMQAVYVVDSGDYARATLICALASERCYGAKAIARREGTGYRLYFSVQLVAAEISAFTSVVGLYQAMIEDCREAYLNIAADA